MKKHFRQMLSLIMSLMMIMSIFAGLEISSFAEETDVNDQTFLGDMDGDGYTSAADARTVLRVANKLEIIDNNKMLLADVTRDGKINAADARMILRHSSFIEEYDDFAPAKERYEGERAVDSASLSVATDGIWETDSSITVEIKAADIAGLESGNIFIEYDPDYLEFISITKSDDIDLFAGAKFDNGKIGFGFVFFESCAQENTTLCEITFTDLQSGGSDIACYVGSWTGCAVPEDTSSRLTVVDSLVFDGISYESSNGELIITNCDDSISGDVVIPEIIEGYPVTTITAIDWEYDAFKYSKIKSITLPESIKKIDADVFYGCAYLENIYYNGSQEQWNEIEIDESNTEKLTLTTIHFNSTGPDNPTTKYVYDAESVELNQTNVELPENRIKKLDLPFAWENVEAYNFDGKYAMFLTIDNATASIIEEHEHWAEYSHIINYKLYYTEDFSEFKTTEYTVDTSRYSDIPDSGCLFAPLGADSTDPDKTPYYYGYKITNINDDKYFINTSAWGDADWVCSFGVVFDNGEISLLDPEVNGNIFVPYDDCYILIDSIMDPTIADLELIEYDADSSTPTFKYNLKVAPTYCYSEDLKNWTKIIGGAEHELHHTSYKELKIGDTVGNFKYFECAVYSNDILCIKFRPYHPQMASNQPFGNANITYNGKDFICLDKIFEYEKTSTFWQYDGAIYGVNSIYSSDTISYGYSNIVKYDLDGKVISEQKLKFNEDWDAGIGWSADNFEYTVSLKNSDKEFINSLTFRINDDSELKIYENDFDMTGVIGGASMNLKDGKTVFMLFDDSIYLRSESEPYNLKFIPVEKDFTNIKVFDSTVFLFADGVYTISESVIQAIVSGDELPEEPAEDGNLDVKGEGGIVTDFENKISQIGKEVTIETLSSMIENENFAIVDKNGNVLSEKALVGTGSKIQILDKDGKVLNEYTILVPTDIDGNGKTTAADARLALRASAQLDTLEGVYATAADAVDDDKITASDARKILRISAGMEE